MKWWMALAVLALCGCDDGDTMMTDAASSTDAGGLPESCSGGPLAEPIPGCSPAVLPSTGDPHQDCVDRINQLRAECQCLPPLMRWTEAEDCANQHAQYDAEGAGPHGGFIDMICTPGGRGQNECPSWPGGAAGVVSSCLQAMWDEGPGEPFSAHGHYINMSNPAYTHVACGFFDSGSGLWSVQNFR